MAWPMELTPVAPALWRASMPASAADARRLVDAGVRVVVSLDEGAPVRVLRATGLDVRELFTPDMAPPGFDVLDAADAILRSARTEGRAASGGGGVAVHCIAGWGRTGTVIASHLGLALAREAPAVPPRECAREALRTFWTAVPRAEGHMRRCGQAERVLAWVESRAGPHARPDPVRAE